MGRQRPRMAFQCDLAISVTAIVAQTQMEPEELTQDLGWGCQMTVLTLHASALKAHHTHAHTPGLYMLYNYTHIHILHTMWSYYMVILHAYTYHPVWCTDPGTSWKPLKQEPLEKPYSEPPAFRMKPSGTSKTESAPTVS